MGIDDLPLTDEMEYKDRYYVYVPLTEYGRENPWRDIVDLTEEHGKLFGISEDEMFRVFHWLGDYIAEDFDLAFTQYEPCFLPSNADKLKEMLEEWFDEDEIPAFLAAVRLASDVGLGIAFYL